MVYRICDLVVSDVCLMRSVMVSKSAATTMRNWVSTQLRRLNLNNLHCTKIYVYFQKTSVNCLPVPYVKNSFELLHIWLDLMKISLIPNHMSISHLDIRGNWKIFMSMKRWILLLPSFCLHPHVFFHQYTFMADPYMQFFLKYNSKKWFHE